MQLIRLFAQVPACQSVGLGDGRAVVMHRLHDGCEETNQRREVHLLDGFVVHAEETLTLPWLLQHRDGPLEMNAVGNT